MFDQKKIIAGILKYLRWIKLNQNHVVLIYKRFLRVVFKESDNIQNINDATYSYSFFTSTSTTTTDLNNYFDSSNQIYS